MWVVEGQDITCSCNVSSLGQPAGRLVGYINTTDGSVNHVTTGDYGASEVKLISDGPDDVTINDPGELYVNPNVATTVEFTCNTSSSKPQVSVTWSGPPCAGQTGSTCRVTLTPDLHLNNITCNATNSITQVARSALRTLSLKYPPPSRPTITGYEGQPLYTGQSLEMTCTVNGGRPSVSGVTFTCDGQGQEVTGQSSIIPLTRLTSSDHGKRCTCSARWGDDSHHAWYNVTSTITLTVYYPPSGLNITYGSQTYPFMVGEIVTLECHAETMGNPPVTLTLQPEGQETGVKSTLTLGPLTVDHNGQSVVCEATNNYTQWSNQPLVERFRLNVYYRPVISLSRLHQDQCRFPVDDDTVCILTEGQRVNLRCEAHGNPGPLNITWSQTTSDVLDVQVDRDTPTAHRCDVNTARVTGDNRLPLNTSLVLTVLVTYEGDLSTLTANQHTSSLTIMESQSVNVTCSATGRPTPAVRLSRLIHTHVTSRPPGNVTVDDKVSLTYADNKVTCDKAGLYVCEVTFHQGRRETRNLTLFVNCSPRVADGSRLPQHLTVSTHPLNVSFSVIAYPPPHVHVQLVKDSAGSTLPQPVQPASVKVMCVTSQLVYLSVCTISVMEAIASHAGFYRVTLNNTLDTLQLSFYLNFTERISAQQDDEGGFGAWATAGVSMSVIGVVVVVVVLVVWKTRAIERCTVFVNIRRRITRQKSQTADIQLDTTPETDAHVYANYVGGRPRNADGGKKRYKGDGTRDEPDDLHDYQNMAPDQDTGSSNYYDRMLHTQDDIDAYQEIHVYANTGDRADAVVSHAKRVTVQNDWYELIP
nr:hypothetical protein BaRGS_035296 [Batillaria attramentaria]